MKKLFSLAALRALLYAAPANANYYVGHLFQHRILDNIYSIPFLALAIMFLPICLMLVIQTLLLRYSLKEISYAQAFLAICIGNIPSTIVGALDRMDGLLYFNGIIFGAFSIALISSLLMIITLTVIFRYPVKKLIVPAVLGNIIASFIAVAFMFFMAGGGFR